jgi:hypothetical protein
VDERDAVLTRCNRQEAGTAQFANCTASVPTPPDAPRVRTLSQRRTPRASSMPCSAVSP